ncbi:MAG TPA: DUF2130 domain-containing protein [Candidatus Coprenecus pullicola]|jgi:hypothetical protein|nr:DUF2130 domain-containing protein [Candidatus Coprenecus pullicola]
MKELKCPKCGNVFQVDEADYASIVNQVKNAEFREELERRVNEMEARRRSEQELSAARAEQDFEKKLTVKQQELSAKDIEISRLKGEMEKETSRLRVMLDNIAAQKDSERSVALAEKDKAIAELQAAVKQGEDKVRIAVMEEQGKARQALQEKENSILQLNSELELEKFKSHEREQDLTKRYENELRVKQEQVDYYKDMKLRMSTKMIGESLEAHCRTLFAQHLRPFMPSAYFEKDNEVAEGTKGDFIFRDFEGNEEYVSIMFEMKNEVDTTATKHKNEDFFKKLDEDRRKKSCEFAVLVSLLEPESDLYNGGIVDVSHRYPKMYVVRPQFFVPIITLLVQTSRKSLEYKRQLAEVKSRELDVTNFENKLKTFQDQFGRHYTKSAEKFEEAIKYIDDTITKLQKLKSSLLGSENNLRLANQDVQDLTIRKLTYKNPTMKQKFEEARTASEAVLASDQ